MFPTWRTVSYQDRAVHLPVSAYQYQPWSRDSPHIRLLQVESSGDCATELQCSLHMFPLNYAPIYIALSYEWGDPSQWRIIRLDGFAFPVTINLHAALLQLSRDRRIFFWIDAICINQAAEDERSACIPLMRQIYQAAGCVFVWLGPEANGSSDAFDVLEAVTGRASSLVRKGELRQKDVDALRKHKEQLFDLSRRTFWRRVWIIQEIAVAQKVVLLCGTRSIDWQLLDRFLSYISRDKTVLNATLLHMQHLRQSRQKFQDGSPIPLLEALYESRASLASDNRDKLYALVGLTSDNLDFISQPNYSLTPHEVCIGIVRRVVWTRRSLDIIFLASHEFNSNQSSRTWVPNFFDFGTNPVQWNLSNYICGRNERHRCGRYGQSWRASCGSIVNIDNVLLPGHNILRLSGYRLGLINGVGAAKAFGAASQHSVSSYSRRDIKANHEIYRKIQKAMTLYSEDYARQATAFIAFFYAFDVSQLYKPAVVYELRRDFKNVLLWRRQNKGFTIRSFNFHDRTRPGQMPKEFTPDRSTDKGLTSSKRSRQPPAARVAALSNFQALVDEGLLLMSTEQDDIGWTHPASQPGDFIYLLEGCSMPAVLRPSMQHPGSFSLVGHAYVVGAMMGEVWSKLRPFDFELVSID